MAEAERIGAELGAAFVEIDRRPPPAGGAPPVRVARLRRDGHRVPAQEALTDSRSSGRHLPAAPTSRRRPARCSTCPGSAARRLAVDDARVPRAAGRAVAPPRPVPRRRTARPTRSRRSRSTSAHPSSTSCATSRRSACRPCRRSASPSRRSATSAILMTEYLAYSIQYRRLLMRFPLGPGPYRDRLLDAMAWLLVDLHRAGVFWGDCSLANTLFRRDGDKIQAFLVDAETSEIHPAPVRRPAALRPRHPRRERRLRLADLGAMQGREDAFDDADRGGRDRPIAATRRSGTSCTLEPRALARRPARDPGPDPAPQRPRVRRRRDRAGAERGRAGCRPAPRRRRQPPVPRARAGAADRHRRARGPGPAAAQRPARVPRLARDARARSVGDDEAADALAATTSSQPSLAALVPAIGPGRDPLQAYCDVLEQKWILSELAGSRRRARGGDRRLPGARRAGARRTTGRRDAGTSIALDIDWSTGLDGSDPEVVAGS